MKIYTEVNFEWDDKQGKLIEVSSKSFDYQGDLILCGKDPPDQTHTWYDLAGNEYTLELDMGFTFFENIAGAFGSTNINPDTWENLATAERYLINGEVQQLEGTNKDGWDINLGGSNKVSARITKIQKWMKNQETFFGDQTYSTESAYKAAYKEATGKDAGSYDQNSKYLSSPFFEQSSVGGEPAPIDAELLEDRESTDVTLTALANKWQDILDVNEWDDFQSDIQAEVSRIENLEQDVMDAYTDLFGEKGTVGEGTLGELQETYETDVERGESGYETDIGILGEELTEGLEGTVTTRELSLEEVRKQAKLDIRSAEAKIGAAGFATTGVGTSAREQLADEIGEKARTVAEGFAEERGDIKRTYLQQETALEEEFGAGGTAYDDYKTIRDTSARAALADWESKSKEYIRDKASFYEQGIPRFQQSAESELAGIGIQMMEAINQRWDIEALDEDITAPEYNPFGYEGALQDFSWGDFFLSDTGTYQLGSEEGMLGGEQWYTPYEASEDLQLYDPDVVMPWDIPGRSTGGGLNIEAEKKDRDTNR